MNSSGSLPIKDSVSGTHKKPRRRRNRNKYKTNFRKKRTKKFYPVKKPNNFKSNTPTWNFSSEKIMSDWYWANYRKAVEWQERHKVAHWKACALALLEENRYLLQIINSMQPGMVPHVSVTRSNLGGGINYSRRGLNVNQFGYGGFTNSQNQDARHSRDIDEDDGSEDKEDECEDENDDDNADDGEDDIEFEMSEEMMQFFEQSYRHKMDLKKLKEKEMLNKAEEEVKQLQTNKIKRSTEMNLLYGDGASMIIGMETAVQLSFDKYCDTKSPKYWPNIPFRL